MKQLTPLDSNFFFLEGQRQPMLIGSVWLCDPSTASQKITRESILQYIEDRLYTTPIFRWRLQHTPLYLDEPYWLEDRCFDIGYHVNFARLPLPGGWRELCTFTSRIIARSVDMNRAPWEIWIIEGLETVPGAPPGSFGVLIRFHHAYADGKSSLALSLAMMEETTNHECATRNNVYYEYPPTEAEMWMRTLPCVISRSVNMFRAGFDVAMKSAELFARMQRDRLLKQRMAPKTVFNVAVSPHRSYDSYMWNLSDLKQIRTLIKGVTLNDVMIAIIAGGLRNYLLRHKALPANQSLISMCPVALRPEDTNYDGGNLVSAMFIPIGTDIEDPIERLRSVHMHTEANIPLAKEVLYHLANAAGNLYPTFVRALFAWFHGKVKLGCKIPLYNTVITNVPGVPGMVPKYFAGAKIVSVHPQLPISDGIAINHANTGIYDEVSLGVVADREVVPDMEFYIQCIDESTQEYLRRARTVTPEQKDSQPKQGSRLKAQVSIHEISRPLQGVGDPVPEVFIRVAAKEADGTKKADVKPQQTGYKAAELVFAKMVGEPDQRGLSAVNAEPAKKSRPKPKAAAVQAFKKKAESITACDNKPSKIRAPQRLSVPEGV